jgi:prephenate dehydratase/chorismate mutase/prephenate dehydratase
MDLEEIRKRIDMIDFEILKLLNSRMEFGLRTKRFKTTVADPKRESEVIRYIEQHSQGLIEPDFCRQLFARVISESKRLQGVEFCLIGFQGEHGAFSEVAARAFDPNLMYISCGEFREVFEAVENGLFQLGIVPVETTLGGTVTAVNEFLVSTELQIIGEVRLPIQYCLLTLPGTDMHEIRVVYSHRHALSQCQGYLTRNGLEGRPYYDEAGAAKMLLKSRPEGSAAVASEFCAEFYNLNIVEKRIEDFHDNVTRFLILSREPGPKDGSKCSILFATPHEAGSLYEVLKEFAEAQINLTRIESMPNRSDPGNYMFFLDFLGPISDPAVEAVLAKISKESSFYKFLGCYPAAGQNESRRF